MSHIGFYSLLHMLSTIVTAALSIFPFYVFKGAQCTFAMEVKTQNFCYYNINEVKYWFPAITE